MEDKEVLKVLHENIKAIKENTKAVEEHSRLLEQLIAGEYEEETGQVTDVM